MASLEKTLSPVNPRSYSIFRRLAISIALTVAVISGLTSWWNYYLATRQAKQELEVRADEYIYALSGSLELPLWNLDDKMIKQLTQVYKTNQLISSILITDKYERPLYSYNSGSNSASIVREKTITFDKLAFSNVPDERVRVRITLTPQYINEINNRQLWVNALTAFIVIVTLVGVIHLILKRFLFQPLNGLRNVVSAYAAGRYDLRGYETSTLELQPFVNILDEMAQKITMQMNELRQEAENYRILVQESLEGLPSWMRRTSFNIKLEEALRLQKAYFENLLEITPDAIAVIDADSRIERINAAFTKLFGYTSDEAVGRVIHELIVPEEGREDSLQMSGEILGGQIIDVEKVRRCRDGSLVEVSLKAVVIPRDIMSAGMYLVYRDITERKRNERVSSALNAISRAVDTASDLGELYCAILQSLAGLLDTTKFFISSYDRPTDVLTFPVWIDQVEGLESDKITIEHVSQSNSLNAEIIRTKKPLLLNEEEIQVRCQSGKIVLWGTCPKNWLGVPLMWKDEVIGTIGVQSYSDLPRYTAKDVALFESVSRQIALAIERKRTAKQLQASEERHRKLLEASPYPIVVYDLKGRATYINSAFQETFGWTADELLNKRIDYIPSEEMAITYAAVENLKQGRKVGPFDTKRLTKDGRILDIQARSAPFTDSEGRIQGNIVILRDITAQLQAEAELRAAKEEAERANQAKSEFLANMSHEIRTPMNSVVGMAELLMTTSLTKKQLYYAEAISQSALALLNILDDILDFSKIQAGKLALENVSFNLRTLVEQVGQIMAFRARGQKIEVLVKFPLDIPSRYMGDPTRIRQILMNLAGNAVKFTDHGHVLLEVCMIEKDHQQAELCFSVADTGIGISSEYAQRIFEKFTQADESTTRKYGGTGLGLAICRELVELMGGKIWFSSASGQGAVFSFSLKLTYTEEPELDFPHDLEFKNVKILIVDDNERNREIAQEYLSLRSITCEAVESAEEALMVLRKAYEQGRPFDMAILDFQMPKMDGYQLAVVIKNDPILADIILILLSSFVPIEKLGPEIRRLFAASLNKPLRASLFFDTLIEAWSLRFGREPKRIVTATKLETADMGIHLEGRVLLVEDSPMNQQVAQEIIEQFGCQVEVASDGQEAVQRYLEGDYDLVFMDVHMPVMDGFEATLAIRAAEGGRGHVPIVAMTAMAMEGDRKKCLDAGMDDYVAKPIRMAAVRDVLVKYLRVEGKTELIPDPGQSRKTPEEIPTLDPYYMVDFGGHEPDIIEALVHEFIKEAPRYLKELIEAVTSENQENIFKMSHRLQGLVANAGGMKAREMIIKIENSTRSGKYIPDIIELASLEEELEKLQRALLETDWSKLC